MIISSWLQQFRTSLSQSRRSRKGKKQGEQSRIPAEVLESRMLLTPLNLSILSSAQRIQSGSWSFGNVDTAAANDDLIADVNGSSTGSGFDGGRLTLEAGDDLTVNSGVNLHGNLELELNVDFYGSRGFVFPAPVDPDTGVGGTLTLNGTVSGSGITLFGHTDNDVFDISSEAINGSSSFTIDGWEGDDTANLNVTGATGVTQDVEALVPQASLSRDDLGFGTSIQLYPDQEAGLFIWANGPVPRGTVVWIHRLLAEAVGDLEMSMASQGIPVRRSVDADAMPDGLDDLSEWQGVYRNGSSLIGLRFADGQLRFFDGQQDLPLQGIGPATFAYRGAQGMGPPLQLLRLGDRLAIIYGNVVYAWESAELPTGEG